MPFEKRCEEQKATGERCLRRAGHEGDHTHSVGPEHPDAAAVVMSTEAEAGIIADALKGAVAPKKKTVVDVSHLVVTRAFHEAEMQRKGADRMYWQQRATLTENRERELSAELDQLRGRLLECEGRIESLVAIEGPLLASVLEAGETLAQALRWEHIVGTKKPQDPLAALAAWKKVAGT